MKRLLSIVLLLAIALSCSSCRPVSSKKDEFFSYFFDHCGVEIDGKQVYEKQYDYTVLDNCYSVLHLRFDDDSVERDIAACGKWSKLPLQYGFGEFLSYRMPKLPSPIPETENGYYTVLDRGKDMTPAEAMGDCFDAAIYDSDAREMFIYSYGQDRHIYGHNP